MRFTFISKGRNQKCQPCSGSNSFPSYPHPPFLLASFSTATAISCPIAHRNEDYKQAMGTAFRNTALQGHAWCSGDRQLSAHFHPRRGIIQRLWGSAGRQLTPESKLRQSRTHELPAVGLEATVNTRVMSSG